MAAAKAIKLRDPIKVGSAEKGYTVEAINIRPPTAKDFRKLPMITGLEMDTLLELTERLSGESAHVIDQLGGDDLAEVVAVVSGFMPSFQSGGSKPSGS